jgi:hypothetical protein
VKHAGSELCQAHIMLDYPDSSLSLPFILFLQLKSGTQFFYHQKKIQVKNKAISIAQNHYFSISKQLFIFHLPKNSCFAIYEQISCFPLTNTISCLQFSKKLRLSSIFKKNGGHLPVTSKGEVVFHLRLTCCVTNQI